MKTVYLIAVLLIAGCSTDVQEQKYHPQYSSYQTKSLPNATYYNDGRIDKDYSDNIQVINAQTNNRRNDSKWREIRYCNHNSAVGSQGE